MKDKVLYDANWITLYENDKEFVYAQRKNKDSVACLCFKKINDEYQLLVHYQPILAVYEEDKEKKIPCLVTGSLEDNETYLYTAQRELEEEVGIINPFDLTPIVEYRYIATTQMNEIVTIYIFDVTNKQITTPLTDGSYYELISENKWYKEEEFADLIFKQHEIALSSLVISYMLFQKYVKGKQ